MDEKPYAATEINSTMQVSPVNPIAAWARGIGGAIVGGLIGYYAYRWLLTQGYDALAMPAALLSLGFALAARRPMIIGGVFCAIASLALMIYCEWSTAPFQKDESLSFFLANIGSLQNVTKIFLVIGTIFGFWFGKGR